MLGGLGDHAGVEVRGDALGQGAGDGHAVGLGDELGELGGEGSELLRRDLGAALEQLGLIALMQDVQADAGLAGDGREVVLDAVGIHEGAHVGAHVATEQAGRHDVIAELAQDAAHVQALAARGLLGGDAVDVVDDQLVELIRGVDCGVHGYGQNHVHSFSRGQPTGPGSTQCLRHAARPSRASPPVG